MLVSATEMINKAHEGHYAIGAFNINNMEWIKAILLGCEAKQSPVILGVSEGAAKYMCGYKNAVDMVKNIMDFYNITVPVAIHLDHGTYEGAKKAIEAGFTSVMFDGSHYPIEENIEKSKELIELAHSKGISIECEVGGIGGEEDGVISAGEVAEPVAIHLDHGTYEGAKKAIEAGFTSVMFDGSHYPFEENLEKSKELIELAHSKGISIECEVGGIGGEEDGVISSGEVADPKECKAVADLGVDFLAAGIGNIHGKYPADWKGLNFEVLGEIQKITDGKPLVLHGGSGIPQEMVKEAIVLGVSKVNINTECQLVFAEATRKYVEAGKDLTNKGWDPRKLLKPGTDAIQALVEDYVTNFLGSAGKA